MLVFRSLPSLISLLLLPCSLLAEKYTTITSGSWNDAQVWSTDGGDTPCNCVPSNASKGNSFFIDHRIELTGNIVVSEGGTFTVGHSGALIGGKYNFKVMKGSRVNFYGTCQFDRLSNGASSGKKGGIINAYSLLQIGAGIQLHAGQLNIANGTLILIDGDLRLSEHAHLDILQHGKIKIESGDLLNHGQVFISDRAALRLSGDILIADKGTLQGSGAIVSEFGMIQNKNNFSEEIVWCAGKSSGIESEKNCSAAERTFAASIVPVEITEAKGKRHVNYDELNWSTAAENNIRYFEILKSEKGNNWISVGMVQASGATDKNKTYTWRANDPAPGIEYYKLKCVDFSGHSFELNVISVAESYNPEYLTTYPNPAPEGSIVTVFGSFDSGKINVYNADGTRVASEMIVDNGKQVMNVSQLKNGTYSLVHEDANGHLVKRSEIEIR